MASSFYRALLNTNNKSPLWIFAPLCGLRWKAFFGTSAPIRTKTYCRRLLQQRSFDFSAVPSNNKTALALSSLLLSLPLFPSIVSCEACNPGGEESEAVKTTPNPSSPSSCECPATPKPCTAEAMIPKFRSDHCSSCGNSPTDSSRQNNSSNKKPGTKNSKAPMNWCESATDLTHQQLVRQACQLSVDSITRILCETISAYQDYHDKYRCLLDALIDALDGSRTAYGVQLELLDCKLIMMRAEVDNMKNRIVELESFMGSVQRLADAMAETAYLGHAEYHSIAMSERVQSVLREMKDIKEESARKERDMIELQTVVIVESGRGLK